MSLLRSRKDGNGGGSLLCTAGQRRGGCAGMNRAGMNRFTGVVKAVTELPSDE